jgi:hypothetical protein
LYRQFLPYILVSYPSNRKTLGKMSQKIISKSSSAACSFKMFI